MGRTGYSGDAESTKGRRRLKAHALDCLAYLFLPFCLWSFTATIFSEGVSAPTIHRVLMASVHLPLLFCAVEVWQRGLLSKRLLKLVVMEGSAPASLRASLIRALVKWGWLILRSVLYAVACWRDPTWYYDPPFCPIWGRWWLLLSVAWILIDSIVWFIRDAPPHDELAGTSVETQRKRPKQPTRGFEVVNPVPPPAR